MSNYQSWEDDPAAQDNDLAQQAQQINLNSRPQQQGLRAGALSFNPGASSFQPFAPQQQNHPYGYQGQGGTYPQYGGYGQPVYQGYPGQYPNQHPGPPPNYMPQGVAPQQQDVPPPNFSSNAPGSAPQAATPQAAQPPAAPAVPTAPAAAPSTPAAASNPAPAPVPAPAAPAKTKVLSIGPTTTPKADSTKKEEKEKNQDAGAAAAEAAKPPKAAKVSTVQGAKQESSPNSSGRSSPNRTGKATAQGREADVVEKDQSADVDDETLKDLYGRENVNVIFLGHVDSGKSTLGGALLFACGMVDQRTLDKYKREAKEMGRESWYLSWALDSTNEERTKGITIEVGRGYFETSRRRYSILDAPGHKGYVPSMIGGASQADVGVLVISARKGEYETGFEKGGQTREHAMLAKTQGVNKLIVAVNKMDDPTVEWSEERYKECTAKLSQFLRSTGYNLKTDVTYMPIAAQSVLGIKDRVPKEICPWWGGPSLLEYLDSMQTLERKLSAPLMMVVSSKYRDLGTMVEGKIETGVVKKSMSLVMMPNKQPVEVTAVYTETEEEVGIAQCGSQARLRLRGIEEDDILPGFVLCSPKRLVHYVSSFEAHIRIIDLPNLLTAGFNCVLHVHAAIEEVTFTALLHKLEKGTNRKSKRPPTHAKKGDSIIARLEVTGGAKSVCVERYEDMPTMGRFTLRTQGSTIAVGKVTKLIMD